VSIVQPSPSSQSAFTLQQPPIGAKPQSPVAGAHESLVQTLLSLQTTGVPFRHSPVSTWQVSAPSQAFPLSQKVSVEQQVAIGVCTQPPAPPLAVGSHVSVVQTTPSLQAGGGTTVPHAPSTQASCPSQY